MGPELNTLFFFFFCSRENAMGLIVAIGQPPYYKVEGSLFWDDGISKGLLDIH